MSNLVNIEGLKPAKVLQALWINSHAQKSSALAFTGEILTNDEAEKYVNSGFCDYVKGRVIKIHFRRAGEWLNEIDPWGYDRDNGEGATQEVVDDLRAHPSKYEEDEMKKTLKKQIKKGQL